MPSLVSRYATPLITGMFLVSLVSGGALFFQMAPAIFHGMDEWLSMVLIVPFVLHVWKNWKPMTAYLRRMPMALSLALSVGVAGLFVVPAGSQTERTGPPQFQLAQTVFAATPEVAAPLFGMTETAPVEALKDAGLTAADSGKTLRAIAVASGKSDADLATALLGIKA